VIVEEIGWSVKKRLRERMILPPYPGVLLILNSLREKRPLVLIVDRKEKERVWEDLSFFFKKPVIYYRENKEEIGGVLEEGNFDVLVLSPEDLEDEVPLMRVKTIKEGDSIDYDGLLEYLVTGGYERVSRTLERGEFSVRGFIIDIFPFHMDEPVRIEFEDERVISLRIFNPFNQRTMTFIKKVSIPASKTDSKKLSEMLRRFFVVSQKTHGLTPEILLTPTGNTIPFEPSPLFGRDLSKLRSFLKTHYSWRLILSLETPGEIDRMKDLLEEDFPGIEYIEAHLSRGFILLEEECAVITESDIFGVVRRKREKPVIPVTGIEDFTEGDYVVHDDFGIGIFEGLKTIKIHDQLIEGLSIKYGKGDRVFVPVDRSYLVKRYAGGEKPVIEPLSKTRWERKKEKVKEDLKKIAGEMLKLYAMRKASRGHAFSRDTLWQKELEALFPYEETDDQLKAIEEIKRDMEAEYPMERLLCGEVGFGKTEVAIRASFKAVMDGKQVAILAPTTILAEQHYIRFKERMERFPVRIELLSRFTKSREKEIIEGIGEGKVDIVIGTHRLLSKDIQFKDLGLLIVDEEQKFGVKQKDRLKQLKVNVDYLALSATPIPRTLHMALSGMMDLSLIETPPPGRLSVVTEVIHWDNEIIRDAVMREIERGGQVFFVHNRIETIDSIGEKLKRILPELRIEIAHGRMPSSKLERIMVDFIQKKFHLLLSTAIIESGLDLPDVNTIIINDAHRFGLSDLHQLRGRVGRGLKRGFCYLIIPRGVSPEGLRRISAIKTFTHLGSGLKIALMDLEMRGAGTVLGPKQSGFMKSVGYDMYLRLLDEAIRELRGERIVKKVFCEIQLFNPPMVPYNYVSNPDERLSIYRKVASSTRPEQLKEVMDEVRDMYGRFPEEMERFFYWAGIRMSASEAGILKIKEIDYGYRVYLGTEISGDDIRRIVKKIKGTRFNYGENLSIDVPEDHLEALIEILRSKGT